MKLSHFTDIGLRISMYMAQKHPGGDSTTITELARQFNFSRHHLVKVVQFLSKKGILAAQRGKGGGLQLGTHPSNIKIGQLIQLLEQDANLIDCHSSNCLLHGNCLLKFALDHAYQEFIATLNTYSLLDVTAGNTGMLLQQLIKNNALLSPPAKPGRSNDPT